MTDFVFLLRNKTTMELCTSFPNVFKEPKWRGSVQESASEFLAIDAIQWRLVGEYAKFLRKPLTLSMFVPCDEDGNVLEEPHNIGLVDTYPTGSLFMDKQLEIALKYKQAKERVLFEGFELSQKNLLKHNWCKIFFLKHKNGNTYFEVTDFTKEELPEKEVKTIDDLIIVFNLTITPYALKQIGL